MPSLPPQGVGMTPKASFARKRTMLRMRQAGWSNVEIGDSFGVSRQLVSKIIGNQTPRKTKSPPRPAPWSPETIQEVLNLRQQGYSYNAVANCVGRTRCAIAGLLNRIRDEHNVEG